MKKLLSLIFAVAMMFALAISASAKDVGTRADFENAVESSNDYYIRLTADVEADFFPGHAKEIDLNGHVLKLNNVLTGSAETLIIKNGTIDGANNKYTIDITASRFLVFENVTIKNAGIKYDHGEIIIFNNVSFLNAIYTIYGASQVSCDNDKVKDYLSVHPEFADQTAMNIVNTNGGSFGLDDKGNFTVKNGNLELYKIMVGNREKDELHFAFLSARKNPIELLWKNNDKITLNQGENEEALSVPVVPGTLHPESIPMPTVEKAGYCFAGWLDSDGNKLTIDSVITTAAIYDAKWSPEKNVLPDLVKAMLDLGFSQSRIDQVSKLFGSNNLVGSMFIGNGRPSQEGLIPVPYVGSNFNGPQATVAAALVVVAIGVTSTVYCLKHKDED